MKRYCFGFSKTEVENGFSASGNTRDQKLTIVDLGLICFGSEIGTE